MKAAVGFSDSGNLAEKVTAMAIELIPTNPYLCEEGMECQQAEMNETKSEL